MAAGDEQLRWRSDGVAIPVKTKREREIKGVQQVRKLDLELYVVLTGTMEQPIGAAAAASSRRARDNEARAQGGTAAGSMVRWGTA